MNNRRGKQTGSFRREIPPKNGFVLIILLKIYGNVRELSTRKYILAKKTFFKGIAPPNFFKEQTCVPSSTN